MKDVIDNFLKENKEWLRSVPVYGGLVSSGMKNAEWRDFCYGNQLYSAIFDSSEIVEGRTETIFGNPKSQIGKRLVITSSHFLWFHFSWDNSSGYRDVRVEFEGKLTELQGADVLENDNSGYKETYLVVRFSDSKKFEVPSRKVDPALGLATFLNGITYTRLQRDARGDNLEAVGRCVSQIPMGGQLAATKWPSWFYDRQGSRDRARELLNRAILAQQTLLSDSDENVSFPVYQARVLDDMIDLAVAWSRESKDYWTAFNHTGAGLMALNPTNWERLITRHEQSYRDLVSNLATIVPERRRILLVSREMPVVQDERLITLTDQNFGPLIFSNGNPIDGGYYVMDPVNPILYHPMEEYNTVQFKHHFHAALEIIDKLVPKRVSLTNTEVRSEAVQHESTDRTSSSESRKNSASATVSAPVGAVKAEVDWSDSDTSEEERGRNDSLSVATRFLAEYQGGDYVITGYPVAPDETDFYYHTDLELQRLVKERLSGGALKKTARIELNKTISVTRKTLDRVEEALKKNLTISAKVSHKASKVSVGGKFKTDFQSETKSLSSAKAEIDKKLDFSSILSIEFFSMEEIEQSLKSAAKSLPLERQLLEKLRQLQTANHDWKWIRKEHYQFGKDHGIPALDLKQAFRKFQKQRSEWIPRQRFISDVIRHIEGKLAEPMFAKAVESLRVELQVSEEQVPELVEEARLRAKKRTLIQRLMKVPS